jgi:hypothetical protein
MKMLRGLHCQTIEEYTYYVKLACEVWTDFIYSGEVNSWEDVRVCLSRPVSSPFLLRPDSSHIHTYKFPHLDIIVVSFKTAEAVRQMELLRQAAAAEDESRFAEHFYTALEL